MRNVSPNLFESEIQILEDHFQLKQQLENLYTGQYDPTKSRKKKQRQFDKVQKQTSNQTSLKFDQSRNADGIIPDNIEVNTGHATARKRDVKGNRMFFSN